MMEIILIIFVYAIIVFIIAKSRKPHNKEQQNNNIQQKIEEKEISLNTNINHSGFSTGSEAKSNALEYIDTMSKDGYHTYNDEDWIQPGEYDEYEPFETDEELANRLYNEELMEQFYEYNENTNNQTRGEK